MYLEDDDSLPTQVPPARLDMVDQSEINQSLAGVEVSDNFDETYQ